MTTFNISPTADHGTTSSADAPFPASPDPVSASSGNPVARRLGVQSYNRHAYEPIIHEQYNRLKARLMNLAESTARDNRQAESTKGLMKDFLNQAYFETLHNIEPYLKEFGVIDQSEGHDGGPHSALMAKSLSDIIVNE